MEKKAFWKEYLTPIKPQTMPSSSKIAPHATLDIETEGLAGKFVIAAVKTPEEERLLSSVDAIWEYIFEHREYDWYTHNGMKYDYLYLFEHCEQGFLNELLTVKKWRFKVIQSASMSLGVIGVHFGEDGKVDDSLRLKDFYRFVNRSLEKIGEDFKTEHQKLVGTIDWEKENFSLENPSHIEYLFNDVRVLYEAIEILQSTLWENFGYIPLSFTLPSFALQAFRMSIYDTTKKSKDQARYYRPPKKVREFIQKAYYGGFNVPKIKYMDEKQPIKLLNPNIIIKSPIMASFDINSMYPAQMKKGVPFGRITHTTEYVPNKGGYYHVRMVSSNENPLPMIPVKTKTGTQYPFGELDTYISSLELEYAFSSPYYTNIQVIEGYVFSDHIKIFNDLIEKCERLRKEYKGTTTELVVKLVQNSLYGKFGSKEEGEVIMIADFENVEIDENGMPIPEISSDDKIDIYQRKVSQIIDEPYLQPHWAAWITAGARLTIGNYAMPFAEQGRLAYIDTDSLKIIKTGIEDKINLPIDSFRYGAFKHEYDARSWVCSGPKSYSVIKTEEFKKWNKKKKQWEYEETHCKGIHSATYEDIYHAASGETIKKDTSYIPSLKVQLTKNGTILYKSMMRTITKPENIQGYYLKDNYYINKEEVNHG